MTLKFGFTALILKFLLHGLSHNQRALIRVYQRVNFDQLSADELLKWAERLTEIVERGRPMIDDLANSFPRANKLWGNVLSDLSEQLNHMESIASSLRSAADPEVSLLIAAAVDHMADSARIGMAAD